MNKLRATFGLCATFAAAAISSDFDSSAKKMLIIDARSYAAAVANRAKGGGVECSGMLFTYLMCRVA